MRLSRRAFARMVDTLVVEARDGTRPKDREALAAPIDGVLYFAGEATVTDQPSTVRGAYTSGQRVATEVLAG